MPTQVGKIVKMCVVCGTDVSRLPRTKDPLGRYYCTPCRERAEARVPILSENVQAGPARLVWPWIAGGIAAVVLGIAIPTYLILAGAAKERTALAHYTEMRDAAAAAAHSGDFSSATSQYESILTMAQRDGYSNVSLISEIEAAKQRITDQVAAKRRAEDEDAARIAQALLLKQQAAAAQIGKQKEEAVAADKAIAERTRQENEEKILDAKKNAAYQAQIGAARSELQKGELEKAFALSKDVVQQRPTDSAGLSLVADVSGAIQSSLPFAEAEALNGSQDKVICVACSTDGKYIASATLMDQFVHLWDASTRRELHSVHFDQIIYDLAFSPDAKHLWVCWGFQQFTSIDLSTGTVDKTFGNATVGAMGEGEPLMISSSGNFLVSGGTYADVKWTDEDGVQQMYGYPVSVYHAQTGKLAASLFGHTTPVSCVAFSADESIIASGQQSEPRIILWDKKTGQKLRMIRASDSDRASGFWNCVFSLVFTKDGKRLVGSGDNEVKVFDVATGKCLLTVPKLGLSVPNLILSPDDQRAIIRVNEDHDRVSIRVIDLNTGNELQAIKLKKGVLSTIYGRAIEQSADGLTLFAAGKDGTIRVWQATPSNPWQKEAIAAGRALAANRDAAIASIRKSDDSELAWLKSAINGDAEAAQRDQIVKREAERQQIRADGHKKMAERLLAKETGPGSPRAVAEQVFANSVALEGWDIKSADFVSYAIGLREFATIPAAKDQLLNVNYDITYGTKGGLTLKKGGSVTVQWERTPADIATGDPDRGRWIPINANVGGKDYPVR